jgi:hypothetical protein
MLDKAHKQVALCLPKVIFDIEMLLLYQHLRSSPPCALLAQPEADLCFMFILHLAFWGVEPVVTHQTSWLESTLDLRFRELSQCEIYSAVGVSDSDIQLRNITSQAIDFASINLCCSTTGGSPPCDSSSGGLYYPGKKEKKSYTFWQELVRCPILDCQVTCTPADQSLLECLQGQYAACTLFLHWFLCVSKSHRGAGNQLCML